MRVREDPLSIPWTKEALQVARPRLRNPTLIKKANLQSDAPSADLDDRGRPVFGSRRTPKGPDVLVGTDPPLVKGEVNYFLRRPTDNVVQVGVTADFRRRLADHQREARRGGFQWETLAVVRGDRTSESALLKHFAPFALPHETEWFNAKPELYRYIRWLRDQPFVATCSADSDIETVSADHWLPAHGRETPPPAGLFGQETVILPRVVTGDDYYTPPGLIDAVRVGMGGIDLDPASHPVANRKHKIPRIYTAMTNGLEKPWTGNVWINPPFGAWSEWSAAAVREIQSGRVRQLTALMSTPSITALYMQPLLALASLRLTLRGRLEFWGRLVEEGNGGGPSSGHELVYVGSRSAEMACALKSLGTIWTPYRHALEAAE